MSDYDEYLPHWGIPNCEHCEDDEDVIGKPIFDDMTVHFKCRCTKCKAIFWKVFSFDFNVFDRKTCSLQLEGEEE